MGLQRQLPGIELLSVAKPPLDPIITIGRPQRKALVKPKAHFMSFDRGVVTVGLAKRGDPVTFTGFSSVKAEWQAAVHTPRPQFRIAVRPIAFGKQNRSQVFVGQRA